MIAWHQWNSIFKRSSLEMDETLDYDCFHKGANFSLLKNSICLCKTLRKYLYRHVKGQSWVNFYISNGQNRNSYEFSKIIKIHDPKNPPKGVLGSFLSLAPNWKDHKMRLGLVFRPCLKMSLDKRALTCWQRVRWSFWVFLAFLVDICCLNHPLRCH